MFELVQQAFHSPKTQAYRLVQGSVWGLILLSIAMLIAEPLAPDGTWIGRALAIADRVLLGVFALEYVLRVGTFRSPASKIFLGGPFVRFRAGIYARIRFALKPMLLIDLLAVLAFFPELRGLRALRLLRLLRTGKLFRYNNPFATIYHAFEQNSLLFTFGFVVLLFETLLGGVSFFLVERAENSGIESIADGVWWALVTITTVGFGDITPQTVLGRIVGGVLMVGGMITIALFAGFVGSSLVSAMLSIREEQFRMGEYANHVVICGFDSTTELLLDLLPREIDTDETRVVVFEDRERPREVPGNFLWVQGDPTKQSELDKVRMTHARAVVIVGLRELTPQAADARTILTAFTIRSYLKQNAGSMQKRRAPLYVITEILDSENVDHAVTAGADEVIETRRVGFSMVAHTLRYHGTASVMSKVLMSGSYNSYIGMLPDDVEPPMTYGELLIQLALTKRGGLVIGLRPPGAPEVFNPAKDQQVVKGTQLVYLAEAPILAAPD